MKGFIELTGEYGKVQLQVSKITYFDTYSQIHLVNKYIKVKETYEEIKELIKQAQ